MFSKHTRQQRRLERSIAGFEKTMAVLTAAEARIDGRGDGAMAKYKLQQKIDHCDENLQQLRAKWRALDCARVAEKTQSLPQQDSGHRVWGLNERIAGRAAAMCKNDRESKSMLPIVEHINGLAD